MAAGSALILRYSPPRGAAPSARRLKVLLPASGSPLSDSWRRSPPSRSGMPQAAASSGSVRKRVVIVEILATGRQGKDTLAHHHAKVMLSPPQADQQRAPQASDLRGLESGTPKETRTPNLLIRSQTLYPIELWVLCLAVPCGAGGKEASAHPGCQGNRWREIGNQAAIFSGWRDRWAGLGVCHGALLPYRDPGMGPGAKRRRKRLARPPPRVGKCFVRKP